MNFDSLILKFTIDDLNKFLTGKIIRHIWQLDSRSIAIKISDGRENYFLLISAHSVHARTHLIDRPRQTQKQSHFADFMMGKIKGSTIESIKQVGRDRIMKIVLKPKSELIERNPLLLMGEFMGKHSNIILTDGVTGQILESIKHVDETMSRHREVLPGIIYVPPPMLQKLDPMNLSRSDFDNILTEFPEINWRTLMKKIDGLTPTLAKEIIAQSDRNLTSDRLWLEFQKVKSYFTKAEPQVLLDGTDGEKVLGILSFRSVQMPDAVVKPFDTMSEALNFYYDKILENEKIIAQQNALNLALKLARSAVDRKLKSLHRARENAEIAENYRQKGELLLANSHKVKSGKKSIELINYYESNRSTIKIELDPGLSASANAQRFFRKYAKAKRSHSITCQLIADNEAEIEVITDDSRKLEEAKTLEELLRLRSDFVSRGYLTDRTSQKKSKNQKKTGAFRRYRSPDGFQIYVGRNNQENDLLLRRVAKGHDMWLHARQIHGSHVLVRNPEKKSEIPMPTLLRAANLAATFSKARHSTYVPIDYTWAKYVVKRKGAGFVHYTHQKTLHVEPRNEH